MGKHILYDPVTGTSEVTEIDDELEPAVPYEPTPLTQEERLAALEEAMLYMMG